MAGPNLAEEERRGAGEAAVAVPVEAALIRLPLRAVAAEAIRRRRHHHHPLVAVDPPILAIVAVGDREGTAEGGHPAAPVVDLVPSLAGVVVGRWIGKIGTPKRRKSEERNEMIQTRKTRKIYAKRVHPNLWMIRRLNQSLGRVTRWRKTRVMKKERIRKTSLKIVPLMPRMQRQRRIMHLDPRNQTREGEAARGVLPDRLLVAGQTHLTGRHQQKARSGVDPLRVPLRGRLAHPPRRMPRKEKLIRVRDATTTNDLSLTMLLYRIRNLRRKPLPRRTRRNLIKTTTGAARRKAKGAVDPAREAHPAKGVARLVEVPEGLLPADRDHQHVAKKVESLGLAPVQTLAAEAVLRRRVGVDHAESKESFALAEYSAVGVFVLEGDGVVLHFKSRIPKIQLFVLFLFNEQSRTLPPETTVLTPMANLRAERSSSSALL